jgi:hypothetical protein
MNVGCLHIFSFHTSPPGSATFGFYWNKRFCKSLLEFHQVFIWQRSGGCALYVSCLGIKQVRVISGKLLTHEVGFSQVFRPPLFHTELMRWKRSWLEYETSYRGMKLRAKWYDTSCQGRKLLARAGNFLLVYETSYQGKKLHTSV